MKDIWRQMRCNVNAWHFIEFGSIQIMDENSESILHLIANIDFANPLTASLSALQQLLQEEDIAPTSKMALQAYQQICQLYIDQGPRKTNNNPTNRQSSRSASESQPLKIEQNDLLKKSQLLMKAIKRNYLKRLINLSKLDDQTVKRENLKARKALRIETANFHFKMKKAQKFIQILAHIKEEVKEKEKKADLLFQSRQEALLEEYFMAWRDEALMSEAERIFRDETEQKYELLAKVHFFKMFRRERKKIFDQKERIQQNTQQILQTLQRLRISCLFSQWRRKIIRTKQQLQQLQQLTQLKKKHSFASFVRTAKKFQFHRAASEAKRDSIIKKTLYPMILLKKMKASLELRKVYFKNRNKIIFLAMFLQEIKQCLLRKGYEHSWMKDLSANVEFTDRKLGYPYRKRTLGKVFRKFKQHLRQQRSRIEAVMELKGGYVIKQLIYNYKLCILKQKEEHKVGCLSTFITTNMVQRTIQALHWSHNHANSIESLTTLLNISRTFRGIHFMKSFYRASKFYKGRIQAFEQQRERRFLQRVFHGLKTVLLTQKVNNRLVQEYQNYTNRLKTQQIFQCLKEYCFSEQLIKKRQQNVAKIRISQYADQLFYNLKVQLYSQTKNRLAEIFTNQAKVQQLRLSRALNRVIGRYRFAHMKANFLAQIDKEYQMRFQWKMFNLLKVITKRRKEERRKESIIVCNKHKRLKEAVMDALLSRLLLVLLLKKINKQMESKMMKMCFDRLQSAYKQQSSVQGDFQQSESPTLKYTSQFKAESPSFNFSSGAEDM